MLRLSPAAVGQRPGDWRRRGSPRAAGCGPDAAACAPPWPRSGGRLRKGHLEDAAHLFERVGVAVFQVVVPQLDDLAFAVGEGFQHLLNLVFEHFLGGGVDRRFGALVLDEVAEVAVLALADGAVEADRVLGDLHDPARFLDRDLRFLGHLLNRGLAAELLQQPLGDAAQFRASSRSCAPGCGCSAGLIGGAARVIAWRIHQVA